MLALAVLMAVASAHPSRPCDGALPATGQRFAGRVVAIVDGDTLCLAVARRRVAVRLVDFDAPEPYEAGGPEAKAALTAIALGAHLTCRAGQRSHHRTVAICRRKGVPLGDLMRRAGVSEGGR